MTYAVGAIIEYTSFDLSGYSTGQVVRYAPERDLDPLVYIRTHSGGKPFPVRESQLRVRRAAEQHAVTESGFDPEELPAPELIRYAERLIRWEHHVLDDDWGFWGNLADHLNEMATIPERTAKEWPGKWRGFSRAQAIAVGLIRMAAQRVGKEETCRP